MTWYKIAQEQKQELGTGPNMDTLNQDPPKNNQDSFNGPDMSRIDPSKRDLMLEMLWEKSPKLFKVIARMVGVREFEPFPSKDLMRNP